jgi:hypothetical protein
VNLAETEDEVVGLGLVLELDKVRLWNPMLTPTAGMDETALEPIERETSPLPFDPIRLEAGADFSPQKPEIYKEANERWLFGGPDAKEEEVSTPRSDAAESPTAWRRRNLLPAQALKEFKVASEEPECTSQFPMSSEQSDNPPIRVSGPVPDPSNPKQCCHTSESNDDISYL